MTVETTTTKVTANGNGTATSFSFSPLVIFQSSDLQVTKVASDGTETTLTETTDYTVVPTGSYPSTGSITYPASGSTKLATGETIIIKRVLTIEQTTDLENQGGYFPDTQETALDKLTMIDLQQQEEIDRCVKVPIGSDTSADDLIASLTTDVSNAAASATAAATSATAAASSASDAADSATAAAASAAAVDLPDANGNGGDFLRQKSDETGLEYRTPAQVLSDIGASSIIPSGALMPYAGSSAPAGWLIADGSAVSRATYSGLYAAIGTTYGAGDGSTTFNLPDLGGRTIAGKETAASRLTSGGGGVDGGTLGATGGAQTHTLTAAESGVPAHGHTASFSGSGSAAGGGVTYHTGTAGGGANITALDAAAISSNTNVNSTLGISEPSISVSGSVTVNNNSAAGASSAHPNTQPTIVLNYIIKT